MLHRKGKEAYYAASRTAGDRERSKRGAQITLSFSASPVNGVIEKIQSILSNAYDERVQNDLTGIVGAGVPCR